MLPVFQSLGGAVIVSAGQSIFQNGLINALPHTNPGLDPSAVIAVGATDVQKTFTAANLDGIDDAYIKGLLNAFTLAIPMASIATLDAVSQKWFRFRFVPSKHDEDDEDGEDGEDDEDDEDDEASDKD